MDIDWLAGHPEAHRHGLSMAEDKITTMSDLSRKIADVFIGW